MKLQFDANQTFQLDAVAAVTDLFDGQPQGAPEYTVIDLGNWDDDGLFSAANNNRVTIVIARLRIGLLTLPLIERIGPA